MLSSGFFWVVTYLLIIIRGFQDQTYGMPLVALGLNISWEFRYTFITPHWEPYIYSNIIALSLDTLILCQTLCFWRTEFPKLTKTGFYSRFLLLLLLSYLTIYLTSQIMNDEIGFYIAFWQNLLMSILFIAMLKFRNNLRGQSIYIGNTKMLGTLAASLAFSLYDPVNKGSIFMNFIYLSIFILDVVYIILIYKKRKSDMSN